MVPTRCTVCISLWKIAEILNSLDVKLQSINDDTNIKPSERSKDDNLTKQENKFSFSPTSVMCVSSCVQNVVSLSDQIRVEQCSVQSQTNHTISADNKSNKQVTSTDSVRAQ